MYYIIGVFIFVVMWYIFFRPPTKYLCDLKNFFHKEFNQISILCIIEKKSGSVSFEISKGIHSKIGKI